MVQVADESVPALRIRCGEIPYTIAPDDAPILIGRESPAQIRVDDPRVSRVHARIEVRGGHWVVSDAASTNGMFVEGARVDTVEVRDAATVRLGHAEGIPVTLTVEEDAVADGDVARVGAAVADRREELGFTRRRLAADGVIDQQVLADFEAGVQWPSDEELGRLEAHLRWPPGTIAVIHAGGPVPEDESTEILSDTVQMAVMVDAAEIALANVKARIDAAPKQDDPGYDEYVDALLFDLRGLETMARNAGKSAHRPDVAVVLRDIRRTYNNLVVRAARAPNAPLSRRLYAARHAAELTVEETADAAGVGPDAVTDAEAGRPVSAADTTALEALVRRLTAR
ncbi:FHA domain-containing protein [Mycobacterium sp. GA-2829]|uniref:FHA domain-containing protein n=1 Tax=Mycobacterium sp. GA-2829 TaxID=1772283 RepID=UPI0007404399|nr:FHA domain-containing protein [Mycobacterium sp. GA-2829]KUI37111.1 peptide-binding protein [Mycobacterium sp. GA-2829]